MGILGNLLQINPILIKLFFIPFCIILTIVSIELFIYFLNQKSTKLHIILLCTLDIFAMLLILFDYFIINNKNNLIIYSIVLFTLLYLFISEGIHLKENIELKNFNIKVKKLEINNKTLTTKNDELSAFKHDFNNIMQTIGGLLLIGKYDNLKRYYNGLNIECYLANDMEKLNSSSIKNPEILVLLVNKYELAKQNGIRMNLEVYSDLHLCESHIFQIIRILGILLDNAIEASKECENKILNIVIRNKQNNIESFIIENSYLNNNINLSNIFDKGFSTKEKNSGLGLWKVNEIIKKHKNFNLSTKIEDELFVQTFEITGK